MPRRAALLRLGVLGAVVLIGGVVLSISGCAESLFFWPSRAAFTTPAGFEDVAFTNAEGQSLHGWFIPPQRGHDQAAGPPPAVLHVHGNAGALPQHIDFCEFLADEGFAVMIFDYRGYGRSDPAGRGLRRGDLIADTHAALDALLARPDIDPERVALYGFSIGGVTALAVAAERDEPRAVVAGAPFSAWRAIAGDHIPLLGPMLIRSGSDAADSAAQLGSRPLLLVHGDDDTVVGPAHTERIEATARDAGGRVERSVFADLDHNDLMLMPEPRRVVAEFLRRELAVGR